MRSRLRAVVLATRSYCSACFRACGSGSSASQRLARDAQVRKTVSGPPCRPPRRHVLGQVTFCPYKGEKIVGTVSLEGEEKSRSLPKLRDRVRLLAEIQDRSHRSEPQGVVPTMGSSLALGPLFVPRRPKSRRRVMRQWVQHSKEQVPEEDDLRRHGYVAEVERAVARGIPVGADTNQARQGQRGCWTVRPRLPRRRATQN